MNTVEARFWSKVEPMLDDRGCWEWVGANNGRSNHGKFAPHPGPRVYAHRFSWELHNGEIPEGKAVLHKCDNPPCVNPNHLFLGTQLDNIRDCVAKRRHNFGSAQHAAKLTEDDVRTIKALISCKALPKGKIAQKYGVCRDTIRLIASDKRWRHVT